MFEEHQFFYQNKLVWIAPIALAIGFGISRLSRAHLNNFSIVIFSVSTLVIVLLICSNLHTKIDQEGVHYKMFPFTNRMKTIPWTDIKSIRVVDYDPIGAYGGWGFRGTSKNRALNIYGNIGIKMQLSNGNELLIGTNQRELAEQTIAKLFIQ